jgi:hypothetical protein
VPSPSRIESESTETPAVEAPKVVAEAPVVTAPAGPLAAWMQPTRPVAEVVVKAWLAAALLVGLGLVAGMVLSGRESDASSKPEPQPAQAAGPASLEEASSPPPDPEVNASVRALP